MSAPKNAALPMVALLDISKIQYLLYGLAYAKTLATMSKVSFRYDYLLSSEASAASFGDNFDLVTFRGWVRDEYKYQLKRMLKASANENFGEWIGKQWEIRQKFYRGYQEALGELGLLNKNLADLQLAGARLSAEALLAAQFALVGLGAVPQLVGAAGASMVGWTAMQTAAGKIALGLGTGLAITVAQNWSSAQKADIVLIGEACSSDDSKKSAVEGVESGIPGFVDDLLAPALHSQNESLMKQYTQEPNKVANAQAFEKAGPKPATGGKAVTSSAMKGVGYLFSAKSLFDASSTFVRQWNGQL
jgi:hypothetical protein